LATSHRHCQSREKIMKEYSGNRYPHPEQHQALRSQNHRHPQGPRGNSAQAKGQERGQDHDR
jgi:hypothetical protein